jgi:hypothetical protein
MVCPALKPVWLATSSLVAPAGAAALSVVDAGTSFGAGFGCSFVFFFGFDFIIAPPATAQQQQQKKRKNHCQRCMYEPYEPEASLPELSTELS